MNYVDYARDGRFVTASDDGFAHLSMPNLRLGKQGSVVSSAKFSEDGRKIVVAGAEGVRIFDAASGKLVDEDVAQGTTGTYSATFSPDGDRLATSNYLGEVKVWSLKGAPALWLQVDGRPVQRVEFIGDRLLIASNDSTARLYPATDAGLLALTCVKVSQLPAFDPALTEGCMSLLARGEGSPAAVP